MNRPSGESWSDGPTQLWKYRVKTARGPGLKKMYRLSRVRLTALRWGTKSSITVNEDLQHFLSGTAGKRGAVAELRDSSTGIRAGKNRNKLYDAALSSRDRVTGLLRKHGFSGNQTNMLAEMMVWRGLAYNSSTLAHGSFGPKDMGNADLQLKARQGLNDAIAASFTLGARMHRSVKGDPASNFLRWKDVTTLQGVAIKAFPEKEPGQVRNVNFTWPVNSFGVHHPTLHGSDGQVARFTRYLEPAGKDRRQSFTKNPLTFMARTLYWVHNVHPFRDGNGRTEVLLNWSMARAAGYPLPLNFDQSSGHFKLAATKWGGSRGDMKRFIARGALGAERFVRKLLPVIDGQKIVSSHTDHGAVGMVTAARGGGDRRNLVVTFPVTHSRKDDAELQAERSKNRVVMTGDHLDAGKVRIQIAVNGKHNAWKTVTPTSVHTWARRYPWWTTVEPIYKVSLPQDASFVNFRVIDQNGKAVGSKDYYLDIKDYQNINSRITGG